MTNGVVGVNQVGCVNVVSGNCTASYNPSLSSTSYNTTNMASFQMGDNFNVNGYYANDTVCLPTGSG